MKTRSMLIGVAMAAVLNGAAVNAQVLGGIGGGLGGGLSGGLRDMSTHGTLNGSLGADLDTSSLHRTTRDTTDRATDRARNTTSAVRDRATTTADQTRDKVSETRQAATATTSAAAAAAANSVKDVQIEGAADIAGSATSTVSREGINLAGAAQGTGNGAVNGGTLPQPELPNVAPTKLASGDAPNVSNATQSVTEPTKESAPGKDGAASSVLSATANGSGTSKTNPGLLDTPMTTTTEQSSPSSHGLSLAGDANGSASASRSGVSAEGGSSMSASRK